MYFLHFHTKGVYATKMSQPPLQKCGKGLNFEAQNLSLGASIFDEMNDAKHQPKVGLTSKWCKNRYSCGRYKVYAILPTPIPPLVKVKLFIQKI